MDLLANLALGFDVALSPEGLIYCFVGVLLGVLIGILPGFGPVAAISLLLPVSFHLSPTVSLIMLAGVYYGANYGGSTAAILLNLPGTAAAAVTCLDGYPMSQNGRAGVALFVTTLASFVGSFLSIFIVGGFAPVLAEFALSFSAPEYTTVVLLGLVAAATVGSGSTLKSLATVVIGLLLGIVGTDVNTGVYRFTLGLSDLADGIGLVPLAMGLFGISELIASLVHAERRPSPPASVSLRSLVPSISDLRRSALPMLRGTAIGAWFGILPGTGTAISSFVAYGFEKRISRNGDKFGTGAVEGVAAPEAANNAASISAFVPTLTLGIPGDAVMAIMLGALMINGIVPGPFLITEHGDVFWGLIASFLIGNLALVIVNPMLIGVWVRILTIPYNALYPVVIALICVGAYSVSLSTFDVFLVILFGLVGYGMILLRFQPASLLLGFVLGPLLEENLRRSLLLSRGDWMIFAERPLSALFLVATVAIIAFSFVRRKKAGADD